MMLIFLDAEKAFDNVNWEFMLSLLKRMGLQGTYFKAIKAIYTMQVAKIKVNGSLTGNIQIEQGTRQGCPLSPLLFILVLEILNKQIRDNEAIKGLKIRGEEFKLLAYADDLAIILENPLENLEGLLEVIENFRQVAGFKVNYQKTQFMTKNIKKEDVEKLAQNSNFEAVKKINI